MIRGDLLRLEGLPYVTRLPGLPDLPRGQRLELDVLGSDDVDLTLEARVHRVLSDRIDDIEDGEEAEAAASGPAAPAAQADVPPAAGGAPGS